MTEVAKQNAMKKLKEMERRQEAMENEIEDGLKKFENDILNSAIRQKMNKI